MLHKANGGDDIRTVEDLEGPIELSKAGVRLAITTSKA